jgi:hypothetical protein
MRVGSSGCAALLPTGLGSMPSSSLKLLALMGRDPDGAMLTTESPCQKSSLPGDTAQSTPRLLPAAQAFMSAVRSSVKAA